MCPEPTWADVAFYVITTIALGVYLLHLVRKYGR